MSLSSSGDKDFENLRYDNKFLEAFTYAWGMVESDIDQKIIYEFGLDIQNSNFNSNTTNTKIDYVLRQFSREIEFLHSIKKLNNAQFKALHDFSEKRNKLFHGTQGRNYNKLILNLTDIEKKEYLDVASLALRATTYGINNDDLPSL
jgi:hypothetical protein